MVLLPSPPMARHFRARRLHNLIQQFGIDLPAPNRSEALARRQLGRDYSQGCLPCLPESKAAGLFRQSHVEMVCAL